MHLRCGPHRPEAGSRTTSRRRTGLARAEAEAALELRDAFLATAAHELKTPVSVLRMSLQVLLRHLGTLEPQDLDRLRAKLEVLDQQTRKLTRLLSQLLDTARLDAGKLVLERQPTDMVQVVRSVIASYSLRRDRGRLRVHAPPSAGVWIDPLRFEQVLRNLLDNAIKFSPDGTPIDVYLSVAEAQTVRLAVRDRDAGVPAGQRADIFERYHQAQTPQQHAGIGLGLYISRQIVEAHGGTLTAESIPGTKPGEIKGARFVVTLPAEG